MNFFFDKQEEFRSIGHGKIGGKAQGLKEIRQYFSHYNVENIRVNIPNTTIVSTSHFDTFMNENHLWDTAYYEADDKRLLRDFQNSSLSTHLIDDLRDLLGRYRTPLAIRSSSLLEDSLHCSFAGVYATKMLPNNQSDDIRLHRLIEAIKFVYASTFFKKAKDYSKALGQSLENEKMAVIIQEVVGKKHEDCFYPNISGVARSYNFYPTGHAQMEDGVINLALGLGKTIAEGGRSWFYSPKYPSAYPPYSFVDDLIKQTQRNFWSVNMGAVKNEEELAKENEFLKYCSLSDAERHDTLKHIVSTYDSYADKLQMGMSTYGPRIVTFAPILQTNIFPLGDCMKEVLALCEEATKTDVEIEFAITFDKEQTHLGILQVRPLASLENPIEIEKSELERENILLSCDHVLGNGVTNNITDIVFVDPEKFNFSESTKIASDIEKLNKGLIQQNRPYILIGFGRWGSSNPWLGIPVSWSQISGAHVIVESNLENIYVEMSQGTHFFHNLLNLKRFYFSIKDSGKFKIDWEWLSKQSIVSEKKFVKHVRADKALTVKSSSIRKLGGIFYHS